MSSIVNKIKDAVHGDKHHHHSEPEGTHGPHGSKVANAADPRVDSDRDHSTTIGGGNHGHGTTLGQKFDGPAPHTAGPHSGDILNKVDPRVDSDRDGSKTLGGNTTGTSGAFTGGNTAGFTSGTHQEGSHGPHNSKLMNAADPRVDSDRDGSRTLGGSTGTHGTGLTGSHGAGLTGTHGTTGLTGSHGTGFTGQHSEGNHGPHNSKLMNTVDPRVDSDRDGSRTLGNTTGGGLTGTHGGGLTGTHGGGLTGTHGTTGLTGSHGTHGTGFTGQHSEGNHGPHNSKLMNTVDPRVDSDRDGSRTLGNTTGGGLAGTHGTHGTSTGDAAFGRVGAAVGGAHGTGPAPNTAGPHGSNLLNKVDPRVDSNLDGSKTLGADKTFAQS